MTNNKTTKERLAILETKMETQIVWLKGVVIAVLASAGINRAM